MSAFTRRVRLADRLLILATASAVVGIAAATASAVLMWRATAQVSARLETPHRDA